MHINICSIFSPYVYEAPEAQEKKTTAQALRSLGHGCLGSCCGVNPWQVVGALLQPAIPQRKKLKTGVLRNSLLKIHVFCPSKYEGADPVANIRVAFGKLLFLLTCSGLEQP